MEDSSIHFLQAKHRGGWPLLDISKALPWIKQLLLIFENGASAGLKGKNVGMVLSLGRREWKTTKTHHPLGVKRKALSDTAYQSKNTGGWGAKKRGRGQNKHCLCSSFANGTWRNISEQSIVVCHFWNQLRTEAMTNWCITPRKNWAISKGVLDSRA